MLITFIIFYILMCLLYRNSKKNQIFILKCLQTLKISKFRNEIVLQIVKYENRLKAKIAQMKRQKIDYFHKFGKMKGLPTKMHLILIMWAYSPYETKLKKILSKN